MNLLLKYLTGFIELNIKQRGPSQFHMLMWLEDVPQYQTDDKDDTAVIDKIITSQKPLDNAELLDNWKSIRTYLDEIKR